MQIIKSKKTDIFSMTSLCLVFLILLIFMPLSEISESANISEEFLSDSSISAGSIVSLNANDQSKVVLTNSLNSSYLMGVAVEGNDSAVNFISGNARVSVASEGEVEVYVSDMNGAISQGDLVSVSWLEGVGMKYSDASNQRILGVALENYSNDGSKSYGLIDTPEGQKDVSLDAIRLRILDTKTGTTETLEDRGGLQSFVSRIAGKSVSFAKVLTGSIVFIISVGISAMFIFSAIRNSFISIGRNPLSGGSIVKSLVHVSTLSVVVIIIGAALSYVVLVF